MTIFGVDIASGSPSSRQSPSYSLVILEGDASSNHHMISRHKLIRLIRERQPEIVAMDNVHELASDRRELINLLSRLPSATKLVQVTGGDKPEALVKVARWHGITFDRTNPLQEAEACARLAAKGVGAVLSAFEDRTWIKVSRRRSPGRGGWSQNRYSRKIHGAVKGLAREVERQLREAGLEYTSRAVEGLGGYTRAEFVVEAPRDKVHVDPGYYCDAQLKVQSIERAELQFKPLLQRRGYIIVGLDPGTTTGIAALSLSGELIDLVSARAMSSSDVIEWIAARGRPLVVATDVFPTPGAVEKVKRDFNSVLHSPGADVPAEEKIALAKEFGYKNDHERDALAAAVSAFKRHKNKFWQVEKKVPAEIDPDEVKALVVKGYSIENAIAEFLEPAAPEVRPAAPLEPTDTAPEAVALRSHKLKKSRERQKRAEQIEELKGLRRLKPLEAFSKEAVALAQDRWGLEKGDLVLLEDASGGGRNAADLLIAQGIEAVITDSDMAPATKEYFQESSIPVFSSQELPVQRIDGLPFVRPDDVDAAQARWTEQMRARRAERQAERLESIIQEYRVERRREEKRKQRQ
ncbi:MAG: DUF460 domain-containing protein [Methanothrix sp.]|nr:DUF460 domain-containing protein [Methanothrix sp.]